MNKYILAMIFSASTTILAAQTPVKKSEVPDAVVKSYLSQNSNGAKDSVWEKEIITIYKVKHTSENRIYESQYSSDGKWIKTFTMINQDEIPVLVMNQLKTSYPEFTIERSMIELSNNGKMYAIELRKGKDVVLEYFLMNGKVYR